MLVINAKGVIYDVPESLVKPHAFRHWGQKKKAVLALFAALARILRNAKSPADAKDSEVEGQGCCNIYSNYCPNN